MGDRPLFNRHDRLGYPPCKSLDNLQLWLCRRIQQINCLLEAFILDKSSIYFLRSLYRSMTKQMLNVCNGGTSTE